MAGSGWVTGWLCDPPPRVAVSPLPLPSSPRPDTDPVDPCACGRHAEASVLGALVNSVSSGISGCPLLLRVMRLAVQVV